MRPTETWDQRPRRRSSKLARWNKYKVSVAVSTRLADLMAAIALAIFSIYLMSEGAKLPIGYTVNGEVGAGAFPFWTALGMLICCIWIIINWLQRANPISRSTAPFMDRRGANQFLVNAGLLIAMLMAVSWLGLYGATLLFLILQLRFVGRHSWKLAIIFALLTPIIMFFFFEIALKIPLPKGYTETLFYPLYNLFL